MTDLIACLSVGKGTWGHVSRLMHAEKWGKIILVTNTFGQEKFTSETPFEFLVVDPQQSVQEITSVIQEQLKGKFNDLEIALNFVSGSGKEHMALLGAIHKLGLGIRLVSLDTEGKVVEV